MKIYVGRNDVIGNAMEICNVKIESLFSRGKKMAPPYQVLEEWGILLRWKQWGCMLALG